MCCDCYKEFFGVGLDPVPATYKAKQSVIELICMNLIHIIVIVSNHDTFGITFIIINLLIATIGTVFHFILLKGAHQKEIKLMYICILINIIYCFYMIFFMCYFFDRILSKEDAFSNFETYYTIADGLFSVLCYVIAINDAYKAMEEIKNEESLANAYIYNGDGDGTVQVNLC